MTTRERLNAAYVDACRRHPSFPDDVSAMGTILAEELFEVVTAGMRAMQAINDNLEDGASLENVRVEMAHVIIVARRSLERLS